MKRILYSTMALAVISSAFMACQKEQPSAEQSTPLVEAKPFYVTVGNPFAAADPQSKATFADGKGMSWEEADKYKLLMVVGAANGDGKTGSVYSSTAISIDEKTGSATFKFEQTPTEGTVSFFYGPQAGDSEDMTRKLLEYSYRWQNDADVTPGKLDANRLCLKAEKSYAASEVPATLPMQLVGNVRRFLIYSSNADYSTEKVQSISVSSSSDITGDIAYDYNGCPLAKTNEGWSVAEQETLVRYHHKNVTVKVAAEQQKAITATSKETLSAGSGIYMTVPALKATDVTYVITTDRAKYVLADADVTFAAGQVTNVFVNLERATARIPLNTKAVRYAGALAERYDLSADGETDRGLSWWYAAIDGVEQKDNNDLFYGASNVIFECKDENGTAVGWISCKHDGSWWKVTYEANETGLDRTATITATYKLPFDETAAGSYVAVPRTKTITVTQPAKSQQ